ncbi:MAG: Uma2 family endonuclease [Verrucomicrobia bacterium]|nr:Uma2 family endonuclease [Verrucomicrobiota bacterium]MBI3870413.1 Uma2 family endonuclease [Verrucomicrobiota bacterium]
MDEPYEELIDGEWVLRLPPRSSHESICLALHRMLGQTIHAASPSRLLEARSRVVISDRDHFRPDLALVTAASDKLWLAVEIINPEDHYADTVLKKDVYERIKIPRLWIVDPRYENVEVYHATDYGLSLRETLMVKETLVEPLLPDFSLSLQSLFSVPESPMGSAPRDF